MLFPGAEGISEPGREKDTYMRERERERRIDRWERESAMVVMVAKIMPKIGELREIEKRMGNEREGNGDR